MGTIWEIANWSHKNHPKKTTIKKSESAEKIRYGKRSGFSWQN